MVVLISLDTNVVCNGGSESDVFVLVMKLLIYMYSETGSDLLAERCWLSVWLVYQAPGMPVLELASTLVEMVG